MSETIFTLTSLFSLLGVVAIILIAYASAKICLPKGSSRKENLTFIWLIFDALIHFSFEGSFLYLSFPPPRKANNFDGVFAELWKEYAKADIRWGEANETVVALELLTVLIGGPMCLYIAYQMMKGDRARHYWITVLSTAEIYGGFMTFAPEWLTGNQNLNTSNSPFHLYVYLYLMNLIWVFIPAALMIDSFGYIALALRSPEKYAKLLKLEEAQLKKRKKQ